MAPRPMAWMVARLAFVAVLHRSCARTWLGFGFGVGTSAPSSFGKAPKNSKSRVSFCRWPPAMVLPTTEPAEVPMITSGIS